MCKTSFILVCLHWFPVITSVQELIGNLFLLCRSAEASFQDLPVVSYHMKTMLNAVVLSDAVMFVCIVVFVSLSPSYFSAYYNLQELMRDEQVWVRQCYFL